MDREVLIVILSQLPLALYTIINGMMRHRTEIRKTRAEADSALGGAISAAGETLEGAWEEIRKLHEEVEKEKEKRRGLEKQLRRWTRYASQLADQASRSNLPQIPFPPESEP